MVYLTISFLLTIAAVFTKIMKTPIFQRDRNCNILAVSSLRNCDVAFVSYFCPFLACSFLRRIYDSLCDIFSTFISFLPSLCSHLFCLASFCLLSFNACLLACLLSFFVPSFPLSFLCTSSPDFLSAFLVFF